MSYVLDKIDHLKRTGLVAGGKSGVGMNGGACPDWLRTEQEDRNKRLEKLRNKPSGIQPDIEWFRPSASSVEAA